jgi:hypothetical protein
MRDGYEAYAAQHGAPTRPDDYAEIEDRARASVAAKAFGDESRPVGEVKTDGVRLIGEFPRTRVAVIFRWDRYPDLTMGRARNVWNVDGSYARWSIEDMLMFLRLELGTIRRDLEPKPDENGIAWI